MSLLHPDIEQHHLAELSDLLDKIKGTEYGRQLLVDKLWSEIPADVWAYGVVTATTLTECDVSPAQQPEFWRIETIFGWCAGTNSTGTLSIGNQFQIPVASGLFIMQDLRIPTTASEVKKLVAANAGAQTLAMSGIQLPRRGVFGRP